MNTLKGIGEFILFVGIAIFIIFFTPLHDILWWMLEISIDFHLIMYALMGTFFIGAIIITVLKSIFGKGE